MSILISLLQSSDCLFVCTDSLILENGDGFKSCTCIFLAPSENMTRFKPLEVGGPAKLADKS